MPTNLIQFQKFGFCDVITSLLYCFDRGTAKPRGEWWGDTLHFPANLALASRGKTSPAQKQFRQLRRLLLHLPINLIKVIALHLFRWSVIFVRWSVQRKVIRISKDLNFHPGQTPNISWQDYRLLPRDSQLPTADKHWEIKWKVLVGECCILIWHITLMVYLWKGLTWPRHRPTRTNINLAYWTPEP